MNEEIPNYTREDALQAQSNLPFPPQLAKPDPHNHDLALALRKRMFRKTKFKKVKSPRRQKKSGWTQESPYVT